MYKTIYKKALIVSLYSPCLLPPGSMNFQGTLKICISLKSQSAQDHSPWPHQENTNNAQWSAREKGWAMDKIFPIHNRSTIVPIQGLQEKQTNGLIHPYSWSLHSKASSNFRISSGRKSVSSSFRRGLHMLWSPRWSSHYLFALLSAPPPARAIGLLANRRRLSCSCSWSLRENKSMS